MPTSSRRDDDTAAMPEPPLGFCPICGQPTGECDHLVASIDRTFAEVCGGALFAQSERVMDMIGRLVSVDPEVLESIGAGPALEHIAAIIASAIEEGESPGEALANNAMPMMAALSYMLQEDGDVLLTEGEEGSGEVPSFENLWAHQPESVVAELIERLQALLEQVER